MRRQLAILALFVGLAVLHTWPLATAPARYWRDTGFVSLIVLAIVAAILTAIFEAGWYGVLTGVEFIRVLEFNFTFDFVITPVWWVLAAGVAIGFASLGAQWLWPRQPARARLRPAE